MNAKNDKPIYFSLQPSEMAIFRAAAQIYAAYISSGKVTEDNVQEYRAKSIREAVRRIADCSAHGNRASTRPRRDSRERHPG